MKKMAKSGEIPEWMFGNIPAYMKEPILGYLLDGLEPGGFLYCVLCNDLHGAVIRADSNNSRMIGAYGKMLGLLPVEAWGSKEKVDAWIKSGGYRRQNNLSNF
jgi:hypothetical protein